MKLLLHLLKLPLYVFSEDALYSWIDRLILLRRFKEARKSESWVQITDPKAEIESNSIIRFKCVENGECRYWITKNSFGALQHEDGKRIASLTYLKFENGYMLLEHFPYYRKMEVSLLKE